MPKPLDPKITEVLKNYGFDRSAVWDCHGTWVVYHRVCEQIAANAGIQFDMPEIIEANSKEKIAVVCVSGKLGDAYEWSFGEAAPGNNKNAYPFAMAEKRAKDRVILKLIGLHGLAYSEEEADDFKPTSAEAKRQDKWSQLQLELEKVTDHDALQNLWAEWTDKEYPGLTKVWREQADEAFEKRADELAPKFSKSTYCQFFLSAVSETKDIIALADLWKENGAARKKYELTEDDVKELSDACATRKKELQHPMEAGQ